MSKLKVSKYTKVVSNKTFIFTKKLKAFFKKFIEGLIFQRIHLFLCIHSTEGHETNNRPISGSSGNFAKI